ncbi:MAG: cupin-like domain-containing protein, partial [Proteobacteria bacterium]|nr:cupin-like domain-containing protein [Pseudomonadota bacterium]
WQKILKEHPEKQVKVRLGDYANPENYAPEKRLLMDQKLSVYIQDILNNKLDSKTPPYAGNFTLPIDFLASIGANIPNLYPVEVFEAPTVWLGTKNCITPLHRDSSDNFAIHITGKKRWTIFSPADAPHLYMSSVSASKGGDFATSAIDLRSPNLHLFPEFSKAHPITFDVDSGETLYLPMGWSHFVENLEPSLMVNYWLSVEPIGAAFLRR